MVCREIEMEGVMSECKHDMDTWCDNCPDLVQGLRKEIARLKKDVSKWQGADFHKQKEIVRLKKENEYPKLWKYCPECGCAEFVKNPMGDKEERTCTQCKQDWFVDIDYSDVVIQKLKEIESLRKEVKLEQNTRDKFIGTSCKLGVEVNDLTNKLKIAREAQEKFRDFLEQGVTRSDDGGNAQRVFRACLNCFNDFFKEAIAQIEDK